MQTLQQTKCKDCKWFKGTYKNVTGHWRGDCRIHAPVRLQEAESINGMADARPVDGWPHVDENDFCGAFKKRDAETSEDRIIASLPRLEALAKENSEEGAA